MKTIRLKSLKIENFKGIQRKTIDFYDVTSISGRNASGKTSIADAFSWLLFDKDTTGSSTFAIRPKDEAGRDIDNIEISVTGTLTVDGEEVILTKTQKQKWTKHRGRTAQSFEGNSNEFQVNGFPAKKSEYEQKIHSLIDESLFKLLTNPRTFPSMKWQDQRKILLEFVSEITDESILDTDPEKYAPIRKDVLLAGADKAREKAASALKALKRKQEEYPVRIDEVSKNISEDLPDRSNLVWQKGEAEEELNAIQNESNSLSAATKEVIDIQSQITNKRRRMAEIERSTMLENEKRSLEKVSAMNRSLTELNEVENKINLAQSKISYLDAAIKEDEVTKSELSGQYKALASMRFPEKDSICPTCGRPFEADRIAELKAVFEKRKKAQLESFNEKGFSLRDTINGNNERKKQLEEEIKALKAEAEEKRKAYEWRKDVAAEKIEKDFATLPEYKELQAGCDDLERKLASLDSINAIGNDLANREIDAKEKIDSVNASLAKLDANDRLKERVEELKEQQMECGQKVADQERIVWLLDEFVMAKMNLLSDRINGHFKNVKFKLWDQLINGGIKETCTMQINTNGSFVDFSDANNAAKILGGLDVIDALSSLYEVNAPIFLDNAEALDSHNTPSMNAQLILLEVSDDDELHVERM